MFIYLHCVSFTVKHTWCNLILNYILLDSLEVVKNMLHFRFELPELFQKINKSCSSKPGSIGNTSSFTPIIDLKRLTCTSEKSFIKVVIIRRHFSYSFLISGKKTSKHEARPFRCE